MEIVNIYNILRSLEIEYGFSSIIFDIIGIILTLITFLTVMMSVQYQENIYKAQELEYDIKTEDNSIEIEKKIRRLKFIEQSKKNYDMSIRIFIIASILMLSVIYVLAPIYCVNYYATAMVVFMEMFVGLIIIAVYCFFKKDSEKNYYEDVTNAENYMLKFKSNFNIFPIFEITDEYIIIRPVIKDLKNFFVSLKIQNGVSSFVIFGFKRDFKETNSDYVAAKILHKNLRKTDIIDFTYSVKVNNEFFCLDYEKEEKENSIIIKPKSNKLKISAPYDVITMENTVENNKIIEK